MGEGRRAQGGGSVDDGEVTGAAMGAGAGAGLQGEAQGGGQGKGAGQGAQLDDAALDELVPAQRGVDAAVVVVVVAGVGEAPERQGQTPAGAGLEGLEQIPRTRHRLERQRHHERPPQPRSRRPGDRVIGRSPFT